MSDPTATITRDFLADAGRIENTIKNSEALVVGGVAAVDVSSGKVEFMDDADNLIPVGVVVGAANGDNESGLTGDSGGTYKAVSRGGIVLKSVTVTGASAITDKFKYVYMTDGQTFTLTRPTTGLPVGWIWEWKTSTTCDVYIFTPTEALLASMVPQKETIFLGVIGTGAMEGTSALDFITTMTAYRHFTIDAFWAACCNYDAGCLTGSQVFNLEIGTTDVTGGVLTLAYTSCDAAGDMGAAIAATAITATNEVHIGDTVSVEMAASGTGYTANQVGAFALYMDVTYLPGA